MYCSNCGKEITTFLDGEWEYCPHCRHYVMQAVTKKPKMKMSETTKDYASLQVIVLLLALTLMVWTEVVTISLEDFSAYLGTVGMLVVSLTLSMMILVQEWYRGLGIEHFLVYLLIQIGANMPLILLIVEFIKVYLL